MHHISSSAHISPLPPHLPNTSTHPAGYAPDYLGTMFAQPRSSRKGEYVCLAEDLRSTGAEKVDFGALLTPTETQAQ